MKKVSGLAACLAFLLLALPAKTQTVPPALEVLLNQTLGNMRTNLNARSLSAAIQFSDGAIWAHANGISSVNPLDSVAVEDAYLIGSVTKTLTSACILQLADEGVLSVDDSLYQWLDTMPYINPNITIRQLLQHTSGLYDVLLHPHQQDSLLADISRIWTPEELIDRFISPPLSSPGAVWSYCNTNYFLLGMIIKVATGHPFYVEIRNRFYEPLGLPTFAIPAFEPLNVPVAHVWMDLTGDNVTEDAHDFYMSYKALNSAAGAAGGYFATPTDCTKWMRTYMRGDLLSPAMLTTARTLVNAPGSQGGKYGLGLMKNSFLGNLAYGHGGDLAYAASSWYFPGKDISITVFTNDAKKNSWTLLPVVTELLRQYVNYQQVSATAEVGAKEAVVIEAYPNPFGGSCSVSIELPKNVADLEFTLTNAWGAVVQTLHQQNLPAGSQVIRMDGLDNCAAGMYFLTVRADGLPARTLKLLK